MEPITGPHDMVAWIPPRTGMSLSLPLHSSLRDDRALANPISCHITLGIDRLLGCSHFVLVG